MASYWDIGIVVFFLLLSLVIGFLSGRNIKSVNDYAVANKSYGTTILMVSLIATLIGAGNIIGDTAEIYSNGLIHFLPVMAGMISMYILIRYAIPKFDERFYEMISLGDMIKYFYGKNAEVIASIIAYVYSIIIISFQIIALGSVAHSFLGIDFQIGAIIAGLIIVVYSSSGGIRAVTMTDILQLAILFATIPMILNIPLFHIGGVLELIQQVPAEKFMLFDHPDKLSYLFLFCFVLMPFIRLQPEFIQRCLMTKNQDTLLKVNYIFLYCYIILVVMLLIISFIAVVKFPDIHPTEVMPVLINEYFPIGLKGFAIAGIIAAIMSTADSCLNTSTILLTHNVLGDIKNKLKWMKINTFLTGIIAIFIGIQRPNIVSLWVVAQSFLTCAVCIPLFFGLIRMKVSKASYKASIICGMVAFFAAFFGIDTDKTYIAGFISLIASLVGFIAIHLLENKYCFKLIASKAAPTAYATPKLSWRHSIKQFFRKLTDIEPSYISFGIFSAINYMFPVFLWTDVVHTNDSIALRFVAAIMSILLLMKPIMPHIVKQYFHWYWHLTLTFCLPFLTTVFMLSNRHHLICVANLALAIFLLSTLVDWVRFIIIIAIGVFLGINYYTIIEHNTILDFSDAYFYAIGYTTFYAAIIGLVFTRRRELRNAEKVEMMQEVSGAILHEVKTPLTGLKYLEYEVDKNKKLPKDFRTMAKQVLVATPKKVMEVIEGFKGEFNCTANQKEFMLTDLFDEVLSDEEFSDNQRQLISCNIAKTIKLKGNKFLLFTVIKNIIRNALQAFNMQEEAGRSNSIQIVAKGRKNEVVITLEDNGCGVADDNLERIFHQFFTTRNGLGMGMGLHMCKKIIEGHNGSIKCESERGKYTRFTIILPVYKG